MNRGNFAVPSFCEHGIPRSVLSLVLAFLLALSLSPAPAWGTEGASSDGNARAAEGVSSDGDTPAAEDTSSNRNARTAEGASSDGYAASATAAAAQGAPATESPSASNGVSLSENVNAGATASVARAAALSFADGTYVANIATSPTYSKATGGATGNQQVGTTLYALIFRADKKTVTARTRIQDDSTLTYVWYASSAKTIKGDLPEDAIIPGVTGDALILTDDLVGKYIFVKAVASDQTTASGRRTGGKPTGAHSGVGPVIPAPVQKEALDDNSYVLLQPSYEITSHLNTVKAATLKAGATLWANLYDSEYGYNTRVYHQDRWQYQWLAGDNREADDKDFLPIEGAAGPCLTITDELASQLAGKYIRVRVVGDGQTLYGPSSAFGRPASTTYNTPGPVMAEGQIALSNVVIAFNGEEFGSDYETAPNCNAGDELHAAAYYLDGATPTDLYGEDLVDFSWQVADEASGDYREVHRGAAFTVPDDAAPGYLRVVATAKNGVPGQNTCASPEGRVLPRGVHELYEVSILNASQIKETRGTLKAQAYVGDYFDSKPLHEDVIYTWRWSDARPNWRGEADWHDIPGVSGNEFTVPDELAGKYLSVAACAGDNTVASTDYAGPCAVPEATEEPGPDDPEAENLTATIKVSGTSPHRLGETFTYESWVPATEFHWKEGARVTAWDAFKSLLESRGYFYSTDGGFPYSITTPDASLTLYQSANAPWSFWAFFINGTFANQLPSAYELKDGDSVELRYIDAYSQAEQDPVITYPSEETPEVPVVNGGLGSNPAGNVTAEATPTDSLGAAWTVALNGEAGYMSSWAEPVIANGYVYAVRGNKLVMLDQSTGAEKASADLAAGAAYGCRPICADGKIIVPLNQGRLQAFSASTLRCIWCTDPLPDGEIPASDALPLGASDIADQAGTPDGETPKTQPAPQQSLSTLHVSGGYVYTATAVADWSRTYSGYLQCVNVKTGAVRWQKENKDAGYYWAGAISLGNYVLMGGDDGVIECIPKDSADGKPSSTIALEDGGQGIRSTLTTDGVHVYCATRNGMLHKLAVGDDGTVSEVAQVRFAAYTTSTPTIVDGVAYIGGSLPDYHGVLACVDTATMTVRTITHSENAPLIAEVKSAPLVAKRDGQTYVYITSNGAEGDWPNYTGGGGIYCYRMGDAAAKTLFNPKAPYANYCMGSVCAGQDGLLYYTNDSGHLFALKDASLLPGKSEQPDGPNQPGGSDQPGTPGEENPDTNTPGAGEAGGNNGGNGSGNQNGAANGSNANGGAGNASSGAQGTTGGAGGNAGGKDSSRKNTTAKDAGRSTAKNNRAAQLRAIASGAFSTSLDDTAAYGVDPSDDAAAETSLVEAAYGSSEGDAGDGTAIDDDPTALSNGMDAQSSPYGEAAAQSAANERALWGLILGLVGLALAGAWIALARRRGLFATSEGNSSSDNEA